MYNAPRAASIVAETNSVLFSLARDTFNFIVKGAAIKRRENFEKFLIKIDILADLNSNELAKLCDCLQTEKFKKGDEIIKQGEQGDRFYLIIEDSADAVQKHDKETEKVVFFFEQHHYFGELAFLNNDVRKATVRVTSDLMTVASLDKESFKRLLGPLEANLKRNSTKY